MSDGSAQIERGRDLCRGLAKAGLHFAWADPDLQSFLWNYDTDSEADSLWRAYASIYTSDLEGVVAIRA